MKPAPIGAAASASNPEQIEMHKRIVTAVFEVLDTTVEDEDIYATLPDAIWKAMTETVITKRKD